MIPELQGGQAESPAPRNQMYKIANWVVYQNGHPGIIRQRSWLKSREVHCSTGANSSEFEHTLLVATPAFLSARQPSAIHLRPTVVPIIPQLVRSQFSPVFLSNLLLTAIDSFFPSCTQKVLPPFVPPHEPFQRRSTCALRGKCRFFPPRSQNR